MKAAVFLLLALAFASAYDERVVLHHRAAAPTNFGWIELGATPIHKLLTFTIALKQRNLNILEDYFWKVSNPKQPEFGKYLTREQILDIIAPPSTDVDAVISWVKSVASRLHQPIEITNYGDALKIKTSAKTIQELFQTQLQDFAHESGAVVSKQIGSMTVPSIMKPLLDMVTGITEFPPLHRKPLIKKPENVGQLDNSQCNVPYTMKLMYDWDQTLVVTNPKASQAPYAQVSSADAGTFEGFGTQDLSDWQTANNVKQNPITNIIGNDASLYQQTDNDGEAQLDVQMLTTFAPQANTSFWVMSYTDGWMYEFSLNIFNLPGSPLVNSISYGWWDQQQCDEEGGPGVGNCTILGFPNSTIYINRTDTEFMKLGSKGHTILASSGDSGTGSLDCNTMQPDYPASSRFLTSVGATAVVASNKTQPLPSPPPVCSMAGCNCSNSIEENAAMSSNEAEFDTGGGFSSWIPVPDYQKTAVSNYLNSGVVLPTKGTYNPNNRGYPDIAAVGSNVAVIGSGAVDLVAGTSCSCPIVASMITLLNQDRLNAGKSSIGFFNQILYQMVAENPDTIRDITVGINGNGCTNLGFQATKGWDPLTGLGSPVFSEIRKYVAQLP